MSDERRTGRQHDWYFVQFGAARGPYRRSTLETLRAQNRIGDATLVWHSDLPEWTPYRRAFARQPPPLPPRLPSPTKPARNYFVRHFRGEVAFARTIWVDLFAVALLLFALQVGVWFVSDFDFSGPRLLIAVHALALLVLIVVSAWQYVGAIRAARKRRGAAGALAACAVACCATFAVGFAIFQSQWLLTLIDAARNDDAREYSVVARERTLEVTGDIAHGFATQVLDALQKKPSIDTLTIDSRGGLIHEAHRIARALKDRPGFTVHVVEECASACTIVLLGATHRIADVGAPVGFHRVTVGERFPALIAAAKSDRTTAEERLQELGASPAFIDRAGTTEPSDLYVPTIAELFANHVLTGVAFRGETYDARSWPIGYFRHWLSTYPHSSHVFALAEATRERLPTVFASIDGPLQRLQTAKAEDEGDVLSSAVIALNDAVIERIATHGSDDAAVAYFRGRVDALKLLRARSPTLCGRYAKGQAIDADAFDAAIDANAEPLERVVRDTDLSHARTWLANDDAATTELQQRALATVWHAGKPKPDFDEDFAAFCNYAIALDSELVATGGAVAARSLRDHFSRLSQ